MKAVAKDVKSKGKAPEPEPEEAKAEEVAVEAKEEQSSQPAPEAPVEEPKSPKDIGGAGEAGNDAAEVHAEVSHEGATGSAPQEAAGSDKPEHKEPEVAKIEEEVKEIEKEAEKIDENAAKIEEIVEEAKKDQDAKELPPAPLPVGDVPELKEMTPKIDESPLIKDEEVKAPEADKPNEASNEEKKEEKEDDKPADEDKGEASPTKADAEKQEA